MAGQAEETGNDLEVLRKWLKRFLGSEAYCQSFFDSGKENYRLYKSYKEGSKVYKHNIFVPYAYAYMEDMTAYFMLSILASPITFALEPRFKSISLELCMELEQILHWMLTEESTEFILETEEVIKQVGIFNVGYLINYPLVKKSTKTDSYVFDRLQLDCPATLDVYPEPRIKRLSRMDWCIKKSWEYFETLKELEEKDEEYVNIDKVRGGSEDDDAVTKLLTDIGMSSSQVFYDKKDGRVELLECMSDRDVVTIGGRKAIIRDTTKRAVKPFVFNFPILDCRASGAPGEFFGVATVESIKEVQKELNILRSQRRDNVALQLNKLFWLDLMAGEIDLTTLFSAPGNVIIGSNVKEALGEFPISDVSRSSYEETKEIQHDLQNITSLWDYARGGTPRRRETATGIVRLQQAAQSRNEWILRKIDAYILQPLAKRCLVYAREYLSREDYNALIGTPNSAEEFYGLDPDQLKRMLQVMPLTESIISIKEVNTNQFLQAFDRLIQMPDINRPALIKQLLLKLGQKDFKQILPALSPAARESTMAGGPEFNEDQQRRSAAMGGAAPPVTIGG